MRWNLCVIVCVRVGLGSGHVCRYKAVDDHVRSGMLVGLGTGSTAYFSVERVGQKLKSGALIDVRCIPTSVRTKEQAEALKVKSTVKPGMKN